MKVCKNCGKAVSYNSYFKAYFCNECGWYSAKNHKVVHNAITTSNREMLKIFKSKNAACKY